MSQVDTGECDAFLAISEGKEVGFRWRSTAGEVLALIRVTLCGVTSDSRLKKEGIKICSV